MITKEKLIRKRPIFLENFTNAENVFNQFRVFGYTGGWEKEDKKLKLPTHVKILFAYYTYENYSGDAWVLGYNKITDELFEVNGSHCSCHGLEDQWSEEPINLIQLEDRLKKSNCGKWKEGVFENAIRKFLDL